MTAEIISRIIGLILAPTVMISACAIMTGGLLTRYAAINDRLRNMAHERLGLLQSPNRDTFTTARLHQIDTQFPDLVRRLKLQHAAVTTVYTAILIFITDMLLIAIAIITNSTEVALAALVIFIAGTVVLALAVILVIQEVRTSQFSILYEIGEISKLDATK